MIMMMNDDGGTLIEHVVFRQKERARVPTCWLFFTMWLWSSSSGNDLQRHVEHRSLEGNLRDQLMTESTFAITYVQ